MPWFRRGASGPQSSDNDSGDAQRQREREAQASLDALQAGGITLQAQRRLDELAQGGKSFFTSDLTVNEFALTQEAGIRPVTQVMGSSIYHVGWQMMPGNSWFMGAQDQELTTLSNAYNHARNLALGRMAEEARRAGAAAVLGVRITRTSYDWGRDLIEFNAVGTAVRFGSDPPAREPVLTNLSGQDYWKLHRAGYRPTGIVAGSTVSYVVGGWLSNMAMNSGWGSRMNMEISEFSQGVSLARHRAMSHVYRDASTMMASGITGMVLEQAEEPREVELGNDQKRTDMIFTFHAIGTAVAEQEPARGGVTIRAAVPLAD